MPKYPNVIHWKVAHEVAVQLGFVYKRTEGDHRQYFKEGHGLLSIPRYSEIGTSGGHVFPSMMRQMGLTKAEFFKKLGY